MKLIVGLGNPGKTYENTRHNIGFMVLDNYVKEKKLDSFKTKFNGEYITFEENKEKIILLKPQSYINLSGEIIKKYIDYFKIDIKDIFIIHDDLDLPFASYKVKPQGSSAGHNGLKNIEANLGTKEYKRLKIGISNNKNIETKDYVLGKLSKKEKDILKELLPITKEIIDNFITLDFIILMNRFNIGKNDESL